MKDENGMLTVAQILSRAQEARVVPVELDDRHEFAVALVLQGYDALTAQRKAYLELEDNDGALQMLARHRRSMMSARKREGAEG